MSKKVPAPLTLHWKATAFLLPLFLLLAPTGTVHAEVIRSFDTTISVEADSTIRVEERILYDFEDEQRHGIYRTIPLTQTVGTVAPLKIRDIAVTDGEGIPYLYSADGLFDLPPVLQFVVKDLLGSFLFSETASDVSIRIGDPDRTITGEHLYVVSYTVENAIGYFDDRDEIYWNATGLDHETNIDESSATVILPPGVPAEELIIKSYCGYSSSSESCAQVSASTVEPETGRVVVKVVAEDHLRPLQGLTIAVGFPRGYVAEPEQSSPAPSFPLIGFWYIPVSIFLALWFSRKRFRYWLRRRAYYRAHPIIPEFDARGLTPMQASYILDRISGRAVSAEIIYLAIQGYVRIKKEEGEYRFEGTQKQHETIAPFDTRILFEIQDRSEAELKYTFYSTVRSAWMDVYRSLDALGYLHKKNTKRMTLEGSRFGLFLIMLFFAINPGMFIWIFVGTKVGAMFSIMCVLIGLFSLVIGAKEHLTDAGFEAERALLGLKKYIAVAEKDRIAFHNAPEKTPEMFERLLPYAMLFGLEKKWAAEFVDIYTTPPQWYSDSVSMGAFSTTQFSASIMSFSGSTQFRSVSGGSSGSSSGSSGGGGGGGSTGSW